MNPRAALDVLEKKKYIAYPIFLNSLFTLQQYIVIGNTIRLLVWSIRTPDGPVYRLVTTLTTLSCLQNPV